jgi:hypothetical protein
MKSARKNFFSDFFKNSRYLGNYLHSSREDIDLRKLQSSYIHRKHLYRAFREICAGDRLESPDA